MRFEYSVLSILAAFAAVQAQDLNSDDYPVQCRSLCDASLAVSDRCDAQTDGDRAFLDCFCNDAVAQSLPDCEACVNFYDDDNTNDVNDLRNSCGLPTATYNPSASGSAPATSSAPASTTAAPQPTGATGTASSVSSRVSSAVNTATSTAAAAPTSFTGAAAAATAAPMGAVAAAVFGLAQLL